jgi:hypothetical protein
MEITYYKDTTQYRATVLRDTRTKVYTATVTLRAKIDQDLVTEDGLLYMMQHFVKKLKEGKS